jgi:hypothetical protein
MGRKWEISRRKEEVKVSRKQKADGEGTGGKKQNRAKMSRK